MKKFVTIFPRAENIHLTKDVGTIPYVFHKHLGYDSTLVCIKNGEYPHNEQYTKGLHLDFIEGDAQRCLQDQWYEYRLVKKYITKHAKEIDVLNLYHYSIPHVFLLIYYKLLNRKGIAYLKLDADYKGFPYTAEEYAGLRRNPLKQAIKRWLLKRIDVISAESKEICKRATSALGCEITYVPNGFLENLVLDKNTLDKKENFFLTVGRLGNYQKNTESILRAFERIYRKCDWNLVLVGPAEGELLSVMENLFDTNEGLKERVTYRGSISDKSELNNIYSACKVFLLPSRWESFGLVVVEAQSQGCYLILSDQVVPYSDFTDNGRFGTIISAENDEELAEAMLRSTQIEHDYKAAQGYAYANFTWEKICDNLNQVFLKKRKEKINGEQGY